VRYRADARQIMERLGYGPERRLKVKVSVRDLPFSTMTECVMIAGWIADSISIPVIMDGDTGHGGIMAVRRMVRE
jgi:2-methylisocitrate lyase-like PEP mutase family enzyme